MLAVLVALPGLAGPEIGVRDQMEALYLADTGRGERAAAWYRERAAAEPDEGRWVAGWLHLLTWVPDLRSALLPPLAEQWRDAHPGDPYGPVAVARAHGVAAWPPTSFGNLPYREAGPWCVPALEALDAAPEDPAARYVVLRERRVVAAACGVDREPIEVELRAIAATGEAGAVAEAIWAVRDGQAPPAADAVAEALDREPWRTPDLLGVFRGDAAESAAYAELRALLLARARAMAASGRAADAWVAAKVLSAAGERDGAAAALEEVRRLDPANRSVGWRLEALAAGPDAEETHAEHVVEPQARLDALLASRPPREPFAKATHWSAVADAAEAVGDADLALRALNRLRRTRYGDGPELVYARAALAAGRPRAARRAVERVVERRSVPPRYAADAEAWRGDLAEALDLRARAWEALGRSERARRDLERAVALAPPTPDRLVRLGLAYHRAGRHGEAVEPLARGLAGGEVDPGAPALAALTEAVDRTGLWTPGGVDAVLEAARSPVEPAEPAPYLDGSAFGSFTARFLGDDGQLEDEPRPILDVPGPVVFDLWATWCGPCLMSLPHLDALARRYEGRVTFVALSVDEDLDAAVRYMAEQGEPAFVQAYADAAAMAKLGVHGIPAMFVFDADHRLVARVTGFGPGNTELDQAVDAMLSGSAGR